MKCILIKGVNFGISNESTKRLTFQGHHIFSAFRKIDNTLKITFINYNNFKT